MSDEVLFRRPLLWVPVQPLSSNVRPAIRPSGLDWTNFASDMNWLAGKGTQTNPLMMFQNSPNSGSSQISPNWSQDHGKFFDECAFDIPRFPNPNIDGYLLTFQFNHSNVGPWVSGAFVGVSIKVGKPGDQPVWITDEVTTGPGTTQVRAYAKVSGLKMTADTTSSIQQNYLSLLPVTISCIAPGELSRSLQTISVCEMDRATMDAGWVDGDYSTVERGTLFPNSPIFNQDTSIFPIPHKSVGPFIAGLSRSIDMGPRQSGLFWWMQPYAQSSSFAKNDPFKTSIPANKGWFWSNNSNVAVPFSVLSTSIFPTNIFSGQTRGQLAYAICAYTTGTVAANFTGALDITTSLGNHRALLEMGTDPNPKWFSGTFAGCSVTGTGSNYLPIGNTLCEKAFFNLHKLSGPGGGICIGSFLLGVAPLSHSLTL